MDEYIKREDALSAQNKSMNLAECRKRLERLPAADVVEIVHGKWINDHNGRYSPLGDNIFCSVCKEPSLRAYGKPAKTNFCPNCGADMRKDGDGE